MMPRPCFLRILCCSGLTLLALGVLLRGAPAPSPAPIEFTAPLEISSYPLVFVPITINGRETRALVDTGAFHGIELSAAFAAKIALESQADPSVKAERHQGPAVKLRRAVAASVALGDYRATDVPVAVGEDDIERIAKQVGTEFEALIGWGFFAKFHLLLDYPAKKLVLRTQPFAAIGPGITFPYTDEKRVPIAIGRIDGKEVRLLVDSGAPICNLDPEFAEAAAGARVTRELAIGGTTQRVEFRVKDMVALRRGQGAVAVLGNNVFGQHRVYFDPAKHLVHLVPGTASAPAK
jgi:hypothetical protein